MYDSVDARWEPTSCDVGGTITCNKNTIGQADLTNATTTEDETLFAATQYQKISAVIVKHSTAFTGGGLTAMTVSVGTSSDVTAYTAAFDIFQTAGDTVFQDTNVIKSATMAAGGHTIIARFTSTGANVADATAGSVDIWTCSVPSINSTGGPATAAWESLTNTADGATTYVSNNTAETVTFTMESAFTTGAQFAVRQQTGNPTGGGLFNLRVVDADPYVALFQKGFDGVSTLLTLENEQANAASSVNETADIRGLFAGLEAGMVRFGKTEDYTVTANESSFIAFHTRTDGTTAEAGRFVANGVLDVATGLRIAGGATTGRFLRGNGTNFVQSSGAASGTGTCTNQFARTLNDDAAPTCASVAPADTTAPLKTDQFCYTLFDTTTAIPDTADIPSIWMTRAKAVTVTEVRCETDAGTPSVNLQRDDGTPANILSSDLTCTTGGANGTIDTAEDNLAVGNNVDHVTVSGSTAKRLNVCVTFTID